MDIDLKLGIEIDEFGRPNGVICINKPKGVTSHDIVDIVRKLLGTRKVGHAGTLDPFAEGLLMILVGKATKLSDTLLNKDKTYEAEVLLGISTDSGDPTGKVNELKPTAGFSEKTINKILDDFKPKYKQYVPVFSSVKVGGNKLRELARKYPKHKIIQVDGQPLQAVFQDKNDKTMVQLDLPSKNVYIYELEQLSVHTKKLKEIASAYDFERKFKGNSEVTVMKIRVKCSKGTYIRQLAIDIAEKLNTVGMLGALKRTKIDKWGLKDSYTVSEFEKYAKNLMS
jgi:tRNA pseudouridine55 synthase